MISYLGHLLYNIYPNFILKWRTNTDNVDKHKLYCEKIIIILILLLLYISIILIFTYYNWKECTNIIDIINNNEKEYYNTKLFYRNNNFCNSLDLLFILYLAFLSLTLLLNIIFGIIYYYYRCYKTKKINKEKDSVNEKIIIHIPLYNEDYDTIKSTIDSVCKINYNLDNILLLIVIDGIITNSKTNNTTDYTLLNLLFQNNEYINEQYSTLIDYKDNRLQIYNGLYNAGTGNVNYSVILKCGNITEQFRKGNRGKKDSSLIIYETINNIYSNNQIYIPIINKLNNGLINKNQSLIEYEYMLIIDCDTDIEKNGLILLLNYLQNNYKCIAVCGQTIVKNSSNNLITIVQSFEYFISHLLLKTFEHVMYNVFVLSGCFTLFKLRIENEPTINNNIISKYTKSSKTLYEKNLLELGEDRYLTALINQEYPDYNLSYISDAKCYTNVPDKFKILLDQRRRWTNSLIVCLMLLFINPPTQSIYKHLKMYFIIIMELFIIFLLPLVIIIGIINSVISITIQGYSFEPLLITILIILINLIIVILVCKIDMILKFIPFFLYLPVFSILIPLYSIMNLDNLKWGLTRDNNHQDEEEFIEIASP